MDDTIKGMLYGVGIIAALYLLVKYIVPIIMKGIEIVLSFILWVAIAILIIYIILYILKKFYTQY